MLYLATKMLGVFAIFFLLPLDRAFAAHIPIQELVTGHPCNDRVLGELKKVLAKRPNLSATDRREFTPLMSVAYNTQHSQEYRTACLQSLIKLKPDLNFANRKGMTALSIAAAQSNPARPASLNPIEILLKAGANPNLGTWIEGKATRFESPLLYAASKGRVELSRILIRYGAKNTAPNPFGETPAEAARRNGFLDLANEIQNSAVR